MTDTVIPQARLELRVRVTNNFTGEELDYMIPLPPEVALQYSHAVNTGIAAVLVKAGEIMTDKTVEAGGDAGAALAAETKKANA